MDSLGRVPRKLIDRVVRYVNEGRDGAGFCSHNSMMDCNACMARLIRASFKRAIAGRSRAPKKESK